MQHQENHLAAGLIVQQPAGSDLLAGGAFGPEGGLVGMFFRFVVIAMVLAYLYLRAGRQGNIARLEFPIRIYDNPPRSKTASLAGGSKGATKGA